MFQNSGMNICSGRSLNGDDGTKTKSETLMELTVTSLDFLGM